MNPYEENYIKDTVDKAVDTAHRIYTIAFPGDQPHKSHEWFELPAGRAHEMARRMDILRYRISSAPDRGSLITLGTIVSNYSELADSDSYVYRDEPSRGVHHIEMMYELMAGMTTIDAAEAFGMVFRALEEIGYVYEGVRHYIDGLTDAGVRRISGSVPAGRHLVMAAQDIEQIAAETTRTHFITPRLIDHVMDTLDIVIEGFLATGDLQPAESVN